MVTSISTEAKHFSIYFSSSVIAKLIVFVVLPVITAYLSTDEFGKWSLYSTILTFMIPVTGMMMRFHVARSFYKLEKNQFSSLLFTVINVNLIVILLFMVPLALVSSLFDSIFSIPAVYYLFIPVLAFAHNIRELITTVFRYNKNPYRYAAVELGSTISMYTLLIIFIVEFGSNWQSYIYSLMISGFIVTYYGVVWLLKNGFIRFFFQLNYAKESLKIGVPLIPHALGASLIVMSDRLILETLVGVEAVGIYSIGYMVGTAGLLISIAYSKTWSPWLFEKLSSNPDSDVRHLIVKYSYYAFLVFVIVILLNVLLGYFYLYYMIDVEYSDSLHVLPWICSGTLLQCFYYVIFPYLTHIGRTDIYSWATGMSAAINLVLTYFLVSLIGMTGAAVATFISYLIMFVTIFYYSNKYYPMPWAGFWHKK